MCPPWQYHCSVPATSKVVAAMRNLRKVRYDDLAKVCEHSLGAARTTGGSHAVFETAWPGDARVNPGDGSRGGAPQLNQYVVRRLTGAR